MAADVLLYLSRGDAIREFVKRTVRSVPGSVVVLAHGLGAGDPALIWQSCKGFVK